MRFTVRVPATSANLGPGFDSFGLALCLYNEVTVDTDSAPSVTWEGEGAEELPVDGSDLISTSMTRAAAASGVALPAVALQGRNGIPLERGLGSSAAAAVAGVMLASAVLELDIHDDPNSVLALATEIEGHPDNAAPAILGGLTVAYAAGVPPIRLEPHEQLHPVVLVPEGVRLPTEAARRALPQQVAFSDAVFNLAHATATAIALTSDPELLSTSLRDRLHQDVRLDLVPEVRAVFDGLVDSGVPVCVSGAGPALIAFASADVVVADPGAGWKRLDLLPDLHGAQLSPG